MRKDFISQTEKLNDFNEILEKKRKVLKRWNIINVATFCAFMTVILVRCSAGLNQKTIVPEAIDDSTEYSVTIGRVDIGVNKDVSIETNEYYLAGVQNKAPEGYNKNDFNTKFYDDFYHNNVYYIKSTSLDTQPVNLGDIVTIDSSDGINAAEYNNLGTLHSAHYWGITENGDDFTEWYYKQEDTNPDRTGICIVATYDRKISEDELNDIASNLSDALSDKQINWGNRTVDASYFISEISSISKSDTTQISADGNPNGFIEDYSKDIEVFSNIPQRSVIVYNIDNFFFEGGYWSYDGNYAECMKDVEKDGFHH